MEYKYTLTDNELSLELYDEFEALQYLLDLSMYKISYLSEIIKLNKKLVPPQMNNLKINIFYKSNKVNGIILDLSEYKFKNEYGFTTYSLDHLNENKKTILLNKMNFINKTKNILDNYFMNINQNVFLNQDENYYSNSSEIDSEFNLDLESVNNDNDNDSDNDNDNDSDSEIQVLESESTDNMSSSNSDKDKLLEAQKQKIEKLIELKRNMEQQKKKKEKLEEILRRFDVDYKVYFNIKNKFNEVPEIFKYKYPVFKEMEDMKILNEENLVSAKKYYIRNFNRINTSIGSTIFSDIFYQHELEENIDENIKSEMKDSDENNLQILSDELQLDIH